MPRWARLVSGIAAIRVAAVLILYLSGLLAPAANVPIPLWAYAALSLTFGALGATLLVGNRDDVRAAWLGGVLLLIAVPLTGRILSLSTLPVRPWIDPIRPDAFLPAFLWRFLIEFPVELPPPPRRIARAVAACAMVFGIVAAGVNLSLIFRPIAAADDWRALLAPGGYAGSVYWLALFPPSAAAFVAMLGRMATSAGEDRARLRIFIGGLVGGMLPLIGEVVVEESWPAYKVMVHSSAVEPWVGFILFSALAAVPFVTAYSVVFDDVVKMRVVVRGALQYVLARYTILMATAMPFVALSLYLVRHRTEPIASLLTGARPLLLFTAIAAGFLTLRMRQQWLLALDRRFFREEYNAPLLLSRMMSDEVISRSPLEIAEHLALEIERTLHARADLFVVDDAGVALRDPRGVQADLGLKTALLTLALSDSHPMELNVATGSALDRLPDVEKDWIATGRYRLIIAVRTRNGQPAGLLALGEKRSGLPFSVDDRRSIGALSAPLALALENDRLRHSDSQLQPAAVECHACFRLHPPDTRTCVCGGTVSPANAPYVLRGVFRFEQRIGSGGMGVVYRATDLDLGRQVAVKTLPRVTTEHVSRLRREAQTMASVVHPNLAVIHGIETWRGIPFLVEEYLAGGTLADRLRAGRMDIDAALTLGVTLAGVLGQLHAAGVVHCDIKPSNIGFTNGGVVKLLDFGLAHLLRGSGDLIPTTASTVDGLDAGASVIVTARGLMGTPLYMSPEAILAERPAPAFDLWALAVVMYEAIGGHRPFQGRDSDEVFRCVSEGVFQDLATLRDDCPPSVAAFFHKAFATHTGQRPGDAKVLEQALFALRSRAS
jgi:hypothetical protein